MGPFHLSTKKRISFDKGFICLSEFFYKGFNNLFLTFSEDFMISSQIIREAQEGKANNVYRIDN